MGTIYQRGKVWWIGWKDRDGSRRYESSRSERKRDAEDLLRRREGRVAEGRTPGVRYEKIRLGELGEDLMTDYRFNGKRSLDRAELSLKHLLAFFGENMLALNVNGALIQEYVLYRTNTPSKLGGTIRNGTVNRELAALRRMFNLAVKNGKLTKSHVPPITMLKERNIREGFFQHSDFLALRQALPPYLRPLVTAAYFTGMRKTELLSLTWEQVDLDRGELVLRAKETKNERPRRVPFCGELRTVLEEQKRRLDQDFPESSWVFFNPKGEPTPFSTACPPP